MRVKVIKTRFWHPGEDYLNLITDATQKYLRNGDFLVVSEKALSVAKGRIVDEGEIKAGLLAKILVLVFMRFIWGRLLGGICHFRFETRMRLKNYSLEEGAIHKQIAIRYAGFLQALKYGSEGGIDLSNVPHSYVCLPLANPINDAESIHWKIQEKTGKKITVLISDTDSTFSYRNFHFTSRPKPITGIKTFGGAFSFIVGRALKLRQRATPLAVIGSKMSLEEALNLVEVAHHARGYGAGRTVWDMKERFGVGFSDVTWKMLDQVDHYPIVLVRKT